MVCLALLMWALGVCLGFGDVGGSGFPDFVHMGGGGLSGFVTVG